MTVLNVIDGRHISLDEAWDEAAGMGRPAIEPAMSADRGSLRAEIRLETPRGSLCYARGYANDPVAALLGAIDEARRILA